MKALINRIIEFSNVDGPGNRLSIFFQECPFQCLYCHNPETINRCISCGVCVAGCPGQALSIKDGVLNYDKKRCVSCDNCIKVCPHYADPRVQEYDIDSLLAVIVENKAYIRGITVSGGEPMLQADFLLELFVKVKTLGLTCLIDSNGHYDFTEYQDLLAASDGVMLDVKAVDEDFHRWVTGLDNRMVLLNLDHLLEVNKLSEVRTVLLPGQNQQNRLTIKYVVSKLQNRCPYKLIKYRPYGVAARGLEAFGSQTLGELEYQQLVDYAEELGAKNLILV